MTVSKLLRTKGNFVPYIRSDSKVADVIELLEAGETGALVVTNDMYNILGIVTGRDIIRALRINGEDVMRMSVDHVMTRDVVTCAYDQPITSVLRLMDEHQIRHIPIVNNGDLCGIIDMLDLVKYRLGELEHEANALKDYVAGKA